MKPHLLFPGILLLMPFVVRYASGQDEAKPAVVEGSILEEEAQTEEVSVATGTIFSLDATSISLTPEKSSIPLVFEITSVTPLVDEADKKVARDLVITGIGATVHYVTVGEKLIASKIVVTRKNLAGSGPADPTAATRKRAELTETKVMKDEEARSKAHAVESGGTLMGFEQVIAVRVAGEAAMTHYIVTNSTLFVDSAGHPLPPHVVRTGVGLKVQFIEDAGRKLATRVTVHSMPAWVREGMVAAESGTTVRGPTAPRRTGGSSQTTADSTTQNTNGGNLADGFIYQPILSLPNGQVAGANQPNANQPNANQPNASQPAQPNNNQPSNNGPPGSTPDRNTSPGRGSAPSTPSQPTTPGAR